MELPVELVGLRLLEVKMTTKENGPPTGPWQHGLVWVVGYLALALSVVLAARFAYASADTTVDALIRAGTASVAAVVGCHGPAWIWRAIRVSAWGVALLASLAFAVCLAVTLAGGIGTIAAGSDKLLASRANATATYADQRKELEASRSKRAALPPHRPAGTIESDMKAARVDRRWNSSGACTDATAAASRTFCAQYARLQGELAAAEAAAKLDEHTRELTKKLETAPAVRDANPQANVIARLLHIAREDAEAWYALLFALASETAAMAVLLIAETTTHHRRAPAGQTTVRHSVLPATDAGRKTPKSVASIGRVVDWMPERTVPTEATTATTLDVLHDDYDAWCTGNGLQAISVDAFADEFDRLREIDELAGNIRKVGNRYYGIKLTDTKVTRLPLQRR
jgi:hypothetical protein